MGAQHTPGPWAAFTDDSGSVPHTNIVAVVPRTACVFALPGHHKNDADVRLIAAAPEEHEALFKLVNEVCALRAFEDEIRDAIGNTNWTVLFERVAQAEAAIALATGQ